MQARALFQRAGHRAGKRDFQSVENPGDAERDHDQCVEASPRQAVEPRRDIGLDDGRHRHGFVAGRRNRKRHLRLIGMHDHARAART